MKQTSPKTPISAFTVVELTVTIVIFAAVMLIALPAINSSIRDSRMRQADSNTQVLNQAASRARLAGQVGPGTYGSDKNAALNWYISERLTENRNYKIDWNSFSNGLWFSNSLGDPNSLSHEASIGSLSEDQLSEILRRFSELSPEMLTALDEGGYLAISTAALAAATANGNASGLELYGNTLLTSAEMDTVMTDWLAANNSWNQTIYQWDDMANEWGRDWIKELWTNPDYENDRQWYNWMWDEEDQVFRPYLNNLNSTQWNNLKDTLAGLPEGSTLYNQILDSYALEENWSFQEEIANIINPAAITPFQPSAQIALQEYQAVEPLLNPLFQQAGQIVLPTYQEIQNMPITHNGVTWNQRRTTYVDGEGKTWTISANTWNPGTGSEYVQIDVSHSTTAGDNGQIYANKSATIRPNGTLAWGSIQTNASWTSYTPNWEYISQTRGQAANAQGTITNQWNTDPQMEIYGSNQLGGFSGNASLNSILNDPNSLATNTGWVWDIYSTNRLQTVNEQNSLANERTQYTDPAAYAANIQF